MTCPPPLRPRGWVFFFGTSFDFQCPTPRVLICDTTVGGNYSPLGLNSIFQIIANTPLDYFCLLRHSENTCCSTHHNTSWPEIWNHWYSLFYNDIGAMGQWPIIEGWAVLFTLWKYIFMIWFKQQIEAQNDIFDTFETSTFWKYNILEL